VGKTSCRHCNCSPEELLWRSSDAAALTRRSAFSTGQCFLVLFLKKEPLPFF
jgi:hypothetical protein